MWLLFHLKWWLLATFRRRPNSRYTKITLWLTIRAGRSDQHCQIMMVLPVETTLRTLLVLLIATLDGLGFIVKESVAFGPKSSRKGGVTCEYGGKLYPPGDFRLSSNVTCKCIEQTGELRCVSETCEHRAGCLEYDPSTPARCCTDSVEYGCVYNGTGYPRGANIPAGPCTRCYCPWEVGGPSRKPFCIDFHCPKVQCVDAIVPRGHCCPICPNGKHQPVVASLKQEILVATFL